MSDDKPAELQGPDLGGTGLAEDDIADGQVVLGHAHGEAVIMVRKGPTVFALGATCSHYGGPLAEGVFDGEGVRCPWHHACFDVRTGRASRPPALNAFDSSRVAAGDGRLFVGGNVEAAPEAGAIEDAPESVVIVGGGAAGNMAAETLRAQGYEGPITLVSADPAEPYDRPNLSKDYLAGTAPEDWLPLRDTAFYAEKRIELVLGEAATALDPAKLEVTLEGGRQIRAGAILLATGADPVRLPIPGSEQGHVHYLRSVADSRAIIAAADGAKSAVVVGRCVPGKSRSTSWRRNPSRWSASSGPNSGRSSRRFTRSTAWSSTSNRPWNASRLMWWC
jgi:nitrite reductase/ring-hydroxylating ferredoxin subunit